MEDEVLRLSTIGQILRRSSRLLIVLAGFGVVAGAATAALWSPVYESGTQVLLQGTREENEVLTEAQIAMSLVVLDRTVAGLGWGVRGASLHGSVTAEVTDGNVIGIKARAADPDRARALAERVTEEYITFSTELVTRTTGAAKDVLINRQETVERNVQDMNQRISELQGSFELLDPQNPQGAGARAELEQLRGKRTDAFQELDDLDKRIGDAEVQASVGRENLRIIESAVTPTAALAPTAVQRALGAAVLAVLLGALSQVAARLSDRRLRRRADIAAAVGAPILGTVAAPAEAMSTAMAMAASAVAASVSLPHGSPAGQPAPWQARVGQPQRGDDPQPDDLQPDDRQRDDPQRDDPKRDDPQRDDPQWAGFSDQALEDLRYRRVLARLLEARLPATPPPEARLPATTLPRTPSGPGRLLVVLLDEDVLAFRAVARFAIAAVGNGSVHVMTDSPQISETVQAYLADSALRPDGLTLAPDPCSGPVPRHEPVTALGVVPVSADQPIIPNCPDAAGALLVVTSGTATGGELLAVAEGCHDAGCPIAGVLLVVPPDTAEEGTTDA